MLDTIPRLRFEGALTDIDRLFYVDGVIKGVLLGPGGLWEALRRPRG